MSILAALDARLLVRVLWRGEELDRLLDEDHAALGEFLVAALSGAGWQCVPEATFSIYGERGSIDILAYHAEFRALLVIEIKSTLPDLQSLLAGMDRKVRLAPKLAHERGWSVRAVSRLLVLPGDRTNRRRIEGHAATVGTALPSRTVEARNWITRPVGEFAGVWFVSLSQRTGTRQRVFQPRRRTRCGRGPIQ